MRITLGLVIHRSGPSRQTGKPFWLDVPALTAFSEDVEDAFLNSSELTYSRRQRLLKRADDFGIRRFDANLIIAMVQNRVTAERVALRDDQTQMKDRLSRFAPWAVFAALQSLIIAAGWWVLH